MNFLTRVLTDFSTWQLRANVAIEVAERKARCGSKNCMKVLK